MTLLPRELQDGNWWRGEGRAGRQQSVQELKKKCKNLKRGIWWGNINKKSWIIFPFIFIHPSFSYHTAITQILRTGSSAPAVFYNLFLFYSKLCWNDKFLQSMYNEIRFLELFSCYLLHVDTSTNYDFEIRVPAAEVWTREQPEMPSQISLQRHLLF